MNKQHKLERRFRELKTRYDDHDYEEFSLEDWRTLLAFEMWKDGMEWDDVLDLWQGGNDAYNDIPSVCTCLGHTFGYMKEDCEDADG
jgi:hypothetical protein